MDSSKVFFSSLLFFVSVIFALHLLFNSVGFWDQVILNHEFLFFALYTAITAHITITAMSLSFHRCHTHKGLLLKPWNRYGDADASLGIYRHGQERLDQYPQISSYAFR